MTTQANSAQLTAHRKSIDALTGIRFFAAVYVVIFHSKLGPNLGAHGHWVLANLFSNGGESVSLFFLLSGFILAYTYSGQIGGWSTYRRFWEARFARIWPVYIVSLLLVSLLEGFIPKPAHVVAAFLMLQSWNPFDFNMAGIWNGVCWTLSCEAFFYLLFPFFHSRVEKLRGSSQLLILVLLLGITVSLDLTQNGTGFMTSTFHVSWVPLAVQRLPEFLAGVTLGNYYYWFAHRINEHDREARAKKLGWQTYAATATGIALLCHAPWRWSSLIVLPFSLLIFGLAIEKTFLSKMLSTRVMIFGGGISYSMYLLQNSAKDIAKWIGTHTHLASESGLSLVMLVVLLLMSSVSFEGIEKPARDAIRAFFARRERRELVAGAQKTPGDAGVLR